MTKTNYTLHAVVWLYPGKAGWYFVTLPKNESAEIKRDYGVKMRGWRYIPVLATIGKTSWKTSIFPDSRLTAYLLPLKKAVRKKEQVNKEDKIKFSIKIAV